MKTTKSIIAAAFLIFLIPFALVSGQEKKNEQRIKIVVAEDGGSKVVLDTLITGNSPNDSIVLKNGKTIFLSREENDNPGDQVTKKYIITSSPDGSDTKNEVRKEVTIITSDADNKEENSEKTKYVISRDGMVITVEGSDYSKVRETIKDIEKTLDSKGEAK